MNYLYIRLTVREGEREHTHHCLVTTERSDFDAVAESYVKGFWCNEEDIAWIEETPMRTEYYAQGGEIALYLDQYKVLTKEKYNELFELLYR